MWYNRKKDGDSMDFILSILPNFLVYLFKSAMNIFRAFKFKVNLIECRLDGLRSSDGEGGFVGVLMHILELKLSIEKIKSLS